MTKVKPLVDIDKMFSKQVIDRQKIESENALRRMLAGAWGTVIAEGLSLDICDHWHMRFHEALQASIPDHTGLAAFRCIPDYVVTPENVEQVFLPKPDRAAGSMPEELHTWEDLWLAIDAYFEQGKKEEVGNKLLIAFDSKLEKQLLSGLTFCEPVIGGQAGNSAWFWHVSGIDPLVYVPYLSEEVAHAADNLPGLKRLRLMQLEGGNFEFRTLEVASRGIYTRVNNSITGLCPAPSGCSIVYPRSGDRLIFQFKGTRGLGMRPVGEMPFNQVELRLSGTHLGVMQQEENPGTTWPQISLFSESWIEKNTNKMIVSMADLTSLRQALEGKASFAVIGGLDFIYKDYWLAKSNLGEKLAEVARTQLEVLSELGIKIGIELSSVPKLEYLEFIQDLCRREIIVSVGVNGIDELPKLMKDDQLNINNRLWDPEKLPEEIRLDETRNPAKKDSGRFFEYLTFLYAQSLAEWLGVQRLYVHTNTVDMVFQRETREDALLKSQLSCMKGKGWVIGALSLRSWPEDPYKYIQRFPPAIKPEGMERLGRFVNDFARYQGLLTEDALEMLESGRWPGSRDHPYSIAAVPVMWPSEGSDRPSKGYTLPSSLNTTGAGDMSFAAFMLFSEM